MHPSHSISVCLETKERNSKACRSQAGKETSCKAIGTGGVCSPRHAGLGSVVFGSRQLQLFRNRAQCLQLYLENFQMFKKQYRPRKNPSVGLLFIGGEPSRVFKAGLSHGAIRVLDGWLWQQSGRRMRRVVAAGSKLRLLRAPQEARELGRSPGPWLRKDLMRVDGRVFHLNAKEMIWSGEKRL